MDLEKVDVVIIGGGPAGHAAAVQAARIGALTVLIEQRSENDGAYRPMGTIPSKMLREAVLSFGEVRPQQEIAALEWIERVDRILVREMCIRRENLERLGVQVVAGRGFFENVDRVAVVDHAETTRRFQAGRTIVAPGTIPRRRPEVPFDGEVIFDADFIFAPDSRRQLLPESVIILGGGIVGAEYACMFSRLGRRVRLVERRRELFDFADQTIVRQLLSRMEANRVELLLGAEFTAIGRTPEGKGRVEMKGGPALEADAVLVATGRQANTQTLNLESIGVELDEKGLIVVDDDFRSSVPEIFAAGDVIGFPALASTSGEQGRLAACRALDQPAEASTAPLAHTIHTIPEISMVGMTERKLEEKGLSYVAGLVLAREVPKARMAGDDTGALKLLFHPENGKLYGVHIIGEQASELIHLGQAALAAKLPIRYFVETVFNRPSYTEAYQIAARNGLAAIAGRPEP